MRRPVGVVDVCVTGERLGGKRDRGWGRLLEVGGVGAYDAG